MNFRQIINVSREISSLESIFNINNERGFGDGISNERQLNYQIQYEKDLKKWVIIDNLYAAILEVYYSHYSASIKISYYIK